MANTESPDLIFFDAPDLIIPGPVLVSQNEDITFYALDDTD